MNTHRSHLDNHVMLPAIATTILFAITAVCATQAASRVGSHPANLIRLVLALMILGLWHLIWGTPIHGFPKMQLLLAGVIGFGIGGMCMFQAFPRLGSTLSLLVVECSAAVFSITLGWLWLKQEISISQSVFAFLSITGVVFGLFPKDFPKTTLKVTLIGVGFTIAASLAQSFSFLISKHAFMQLAKSGAEIAPMSAATYRLTGGSIIAVLVVLIFTFNQTSSPTAGFRDFVKRVKSAWPWIIGNTLAGPIFGVTFMLWAIREVGNPGLVQSVVATATLLSVPFSRLTERRVLHSNYYIGATISIIGTAGLLTNPF